MASIPLLVPSLKGNEQKYIKECIDTEWVSSAGKYVDRFEKKIAEYTNSKFAIACINGTSALQIALKIAGVTEKNEVLISSLTFIASVNAISYNNALPVFMDSDNYYNIDVNKTIDFIKNKTVFKNGYTYNKKTKNKISAIVPVHVWGNACWLDDLVELCESRNISVIEDSAESLGTFYTEGRYKGLHTGTIGKLGCLSFNGNKIITTGGGGMILTNDEKLNEKARYFTTQAKDDKVHYIHNNIGYNFRLTNMQAAIGVAQLEQLPEFLIKKKYINKVYSRFIKNIHGIELVGVPKYAENNHWMNIIKIKPKQYNITKEELMIRLKKKGIETRPVWRLNHEQIPYKSNDTYRMEKSKCLVNESLCLPSSVSLTKKNIETIVHQLNG
jgi:perosamine synthetase